MVDLLREGTTFETAQGAACSSISEWGHCKQGAGLNTKHLLIRREAQLQDKLADTGSVPSTPAFFSQRSMPLPGFGSLHSCGSADVEDFRSAQRFPSPRSPVARSADGAEAPKSGASLLLAALPGLAYCSGASAFQGGRTLLAAAWPLAHCTLAYAVQARRGACVGLAPTPGISHNMLPGCLNRSAVRAASIGMVLFNKVALSSYGFHHPTVLLLFQFAMCAGLTCQCAGRRGVLAFEACPQLHGHRAGDGGAQGTQQAWLACA